MLVDEVASCDFIISSLFYCSSNVGQSSRFSSFFLWMTTDLDYECVNLINCPNWVGLFDCLSGDFRGVWLL